VPTATPPATPTPVPISPLDFKLSVKWGSLGSTIGRFDSPRDLAIDGQGNIYVLDFNNSLIQKFNPTGEYITRWGGKSFIQGTFTNPTAITIDQQTNTVYVADETGRVQSFQSDGTFIRSWGNLSTDEVQLEKPVALAAGPLSTVWVSDTDDNRIQRVTAAGVYQTELIGCNGSGAFSNVGAMVATLSGDIYVADSDNDRVHWLSSTGESLAFWGSTGTGESQFNNPQGIALDSLGNVYVSDTGNHRIQVFRSDGTFLGSWGSKGASNGKFDQPMGIAVNASGTIYVADSGNHRIQMFPKIDLTELPPAERPFIPGIQTIDLAIDPDHTSGEGLTIGTTAQLSQGFKPRFGSISIIDVFLTNNGAGSRSLTLSLKRGGSDGQLILCSTQDTRFDEGESGWFSFDIRNFRINPGDLFTIELTPAPGADIVWGRTLENDYADGEAAINRVTQTFDWKFRTWGFT
jgi:sugar lactone lactonase YvrE